MPASHIQIEYSNNGGSTWIDYGAADGEKIKLVTDGLSHYFKIGKAVNGATTINDQLRITITSGAYFEIKKLAIWLSTEGCTGCTCAVEKASYTYQDNFSTVKTVPVSGWAGWNIIQLSSTYGGSNTWTDMYKLRLTFKITGVDANKNPLNVSKILAYSSNCWYAPSNLANSGHLYSYDYL